MSHVRSPFSGDARDAPSVVHVQWSGRTGGIGRLVLDLATAQAELGLPVLVAFGQAEGPFARAVRQAGIEVVDLNLRSGYDLRPRVLAAGARVLRCADIVHLHGFNVPIAIICLAARRPLVFTEHGNFALGRIPHLSERLKHRLQGKFLARRCAVVVSNSEHTAQRVHDFYGLRRVHTTVIHNGIAPVSGDITVRPSDVPVTIGFVGRLVPFKRVDRLLHALARTRSRDDMRVVVVGGGPLEPELRALANALDLGDTVDFLGHKDDVNEVMKTLDVVIQPSQNEPFGLALVEAYGHGALPIAFADGGGALEVLPPDGLVVDTVDDLAAELDAVIGSSILSTDARHRRAAWARDTFPIARTAKSYAEIYHGAMRVQ